MKIQSTSNPNDYQKRSILDLWNKEYPRQLIHQTMADLDMYLNNLYDQQHFFAMFGESIAGWAFAFTREEETWFAIIVDGKYQNKKIGSDLLGALKKSYKELNGWVSDRRDYIKWNNEPYQSPLAFYSKQGFAVCEDIRLETEKLSAIKINWSI